MEASVTAAVHQQKRNVSCLFERQSVYPLPKLLFKKEERAAVFERCLDLRSLAMAVEASFSGVEGQ